VSKTSNNHISLPKTTLLKFSTSGNIKFLDIKSNTIKPRKAATYNTSESYYSENIENFLSTKIETEIGRLSKNIEKYRNDSTAFSWNPDELREIVFSWIVVQQMRTDKAKEDLRAVSIFKDIFPQNIYAQFVSENFGVFYNYGKRIFDNFPNLGFNLDISLCILPTSCESTFLLPTTHCIGVQSGLFFILSPVSCIFYAPQKNLPKNRLVQFADDGVDYLIEHFIRNEAQHGDGHLIGHENQLLKAQKFIRENGIQVATT